MNDAISNAGPALAGDDSPLQEPSRLNPAPTKDRFWPSPEWRVVAWSNVG